MKPDARKTRSGRRGGLARAAALLLMAGPAPGRPAPAEPAFHPPIPVVPASAGALPAPPTGTDSSEPAPDPPPTLTDSAMADSAQPAQSAPPRAAPAENLLIMSKVVVRPRRRQLQARDLPGSVDVIGADQIEKGSVDRPFELLRRMPGVAVELFNQGIIAGDISLRGFNPYGDVAPLKLLIDGIPSNLHSGFADLKPLFPLEIQRFELLRGTHDPRYGLYAVAGNLQVFTRQGGNYGQLRGTVGSFDNYEALAASGFEKGGLSQNLFGAFRYNGGFRQHADLQKYALSGKWFYQAGPRVRAGVIARMFRMGADAPGYLTRMQARTEPQASPPFAENDGGIQSNGQGSAHLEADLTDHLFWTLRGYHQTFDRRRFVRFTEAVPQQERNESEKHSGALTQLTFRPGGPGILHDFSLSAGTDLEYQDNLYQLYLTDGARKPVTAKRDQKFDLLNNGAFAAAEAQPWRWLRLGGGLRWDRLDGGMRNRLAGGQVMPMLDFGNIWQPKANLMVTAPGGYSVYGNYGRTFQTPLRDGLYGAQPGVSYSRNDGWEAGVKAAARWANGRVAYWRQTASDEVRLKISPAADVENVGETLRHGIDVQAEVTPFEALTLWGAYTLQRAIIVDPVANLPALANQSLDHVPGFLLKAGIDSRPIKSLTASAWIYAQGAYSITDTTNLAIVPPDSRFGGYTLVNADLSYAWRRFTFSGHVRNLLDTRWNSTVWNDGTVTLYNPGDGRAFFASVETAFW